jgi:hypothetical protein
LLDDPVADIVQVTLPETMSELSALIHTPGWHWLRQVCEQLNLAIELIDRRMTPLLHLAAERPGSRAHALITRLPDSPLPRLASATFDSAQPRSTTLGGIAVVCMPITYRGRTAAVLVVADEILRHQTENGIHAELGRVASALAGAITTQLVAPSADAPSDVFRLSNLHRLLRQAVVSGSDREVLRAFIEALAVWRDLEAWAYRSDVAGRFTVDVALPGSDQMRVPPELARDPVEEHRLVQRIAPGGRAALGLGRCGDVIVARVRYRADVDWLLVMTGDLDDRLESQLALYLDALQQALGEVAAVEASRLTWAMLQHLVGGDDVMRRAVRGAVTELEFVTDSTARLIIARGDGTPVLTLRDGGEPPVDPGAAAESHRLCESAPLGAHVLTIVLERGSGRAFSRREERLLRVAVATIAPWLETMAPRLSSAEFSRRARSRSFDELIEQRASDPALEPGDLAVVVVAFAEQAPPVDVARDLVGRVRGTLRDTDLAGRLTSGDIGILLLDTPVAGAEVVARRLRTMLASDFSDSSTPRAVVGLAGFPVAGADSLLAQARADAIRALEAEQASRDFPS